MKLWWNFLYKKVARLRGRVETLHKPQNGFQGYLQRHFYTLYTYIYMKVRYSKQR